MNFVHPTYESIISCCNMESSKASKNVHVCNWEGCNKTYPKPSKLKEHLRSHTDERPFICTYQNCNKAYRRPSHLNVHKQSAHPSSSTDTNPVTTVYKCTHIDCMAKFPNKYHLKRHFEFVHQGEHKYKCTEQGCDASFTKSYYLNRHLVNTHNQRLPYPCRYSHCPLRFTYPSRRILHEKRHEKYQEKLCGINQCPLIFISSLCLKRHISQVHSTSTLL